MPMVNRSNLLRRIFIALGLQQGLERWGQVLDEPDRNGVSYLCGNLLAVSEKTIFVRECLQPGCFPQGHSAIVSRVPEPATSQVCTPGSQRWRNCVPSHASVNVRMSLVSLVTLKLQFGRQAVSATAVSRNVPKAFQGNRAVIPSKVQLVIRVSFPGSQRF